MTVKREGVTARLSPGGVPTPRTLTAVDWTGLARAAGLSAPHPAVAAVEVRGLAYDSRAVTPGTVFVAVRGQHADGHAFVAGALATGAVAAVVEAVPPGVPPDRCLVVPDARAALAPLAAAFFGHPSASCRVVGITGTDGKTTTCTLLQAALAAAGRVAGSLTTVDFRLGTAVEPNRTRQTTLEALEIQARLRAMVDDGCQDVALETTSHALALHRVDAVRYQGAVYTAITHEHLDFHGSWEAYFAAKASLLDRAAAEPGGFAVLNRDDARAFPLLAARPVGRRCTYSAAGDPAADLRATAVVPDLDGIRFTAETPAGPAPVSLRMPGRWNVANALAALAAGLCLDLALPDLVAGLERVERVPGRMERVDGGQPFTVVIDYAHTPAALGQVLQALRSATPNHLWVVFGSAGERDVAKRAEMGRIAAGLADQVVVTSEDPREEDPAAICAEIVAGAAEGGGRPGESVHVVLDREQAIDRAIAQAQPGDTVLLAGKGHEATQIVGRTAHPWDERGEAAAALGRRGFPLTRTAGGG